VIKRVCIVSPGEEHVIRTVEGYRSRDGKVSAKWQLGNKRYVGRIQAEWGTCMGRRMILVQQASAIQSLLVVGSHEQGEYSPVSRLFMSSSESSKS
jgi:hypothetical protein